MRINNERMKNKKFSSIITNLDPCLQELFDGFAEYCDEYNNKNKNNNKDNLKKFKTTVLSDTKLQVWGIKFNLGTLLNYDKKYVESVANQYIEACLEYSEIGVNYEEFLKLTGEKTSNKKQHLYINKVTDERAKETGGHYYG